ncbi:TPA: NTPase KAP [Enterobacter cloacae]|nr:NTPase KAP [Enterobacter cloacae]HAS1085272.1 NTPase KAP [Enterobacter cloacae]HAS1098544.1 NTPase KAP [Enterobacter cloacae]HAS9353896.1 NTPase KAP [Enterobacter cloacae]
MDIEWNWYDNTVFLGEYLPQDTLDRMKYANYLYDICAARGENSNLVVNINAEWGAGKTYFTKRLAKSISDHHPTVYIDAWKEDFSDDPLLTVFSAIKEQLTGQSDKFTTLLNKTVENIGPLLKTATPLILEGLVKKLIGVDHIGDLTKDLSIKLLELHSEKSNKVTTIKKGINDWVRFINQKDGIDNKNLPIFIIIDELDRCRPSFAISLLEITKHIFNIPGVVFVIATDTEQLQHSIKVVYGNEFSANHYLSRFFDRRFLLPAPQMRDFLYTITPDNVFDEFDNLINFLSPTPPSYKHFIFNCSNIFESMKINLRDAIKLYERLIDTILTTSKSFDPSFLLLMSIVNFKNNELYASIKSKNYQDNEVSVILNQNLSITIDLSQERTGVVALIKDSNRRRNNYKDTELKITSFQYLKQAGEIIEIGSPVSSRITSRGSYNEEWWDGGLNEDGTLKTMLKMGWAKNKTYDKSLSLNQYYDLIELSTIFE